MQCELDGGDHAAGRHIHVAVDASLLAVSRDELDRRHAAGGDAVAAGQPTHAVAEQVAHHAGGPGEAGRRGEPHQRGAIDDVGPAGSGPHAGAVRAGVDLDVGESGGAQEHRVVERRRGAMAVALRHDPQPTRAGLADGVDDIAVVERQRHEGGALVDGEVEGATGGVPADVPGLEQHPLAHCLA